MTFYANETTLGLVFCSIPAIVSLYFYSVDKPRAALYLLLLSAFLLRILMISLDPFVHEWDERFHALVAKHMMQDPFKPMLFERHIMPFNYYDWAYNHIWVHKQPLFLWQMAISMKIFGIHTWALRLPSAILGTIMVWLIYDMAKNWIRDQNSSYLAAFIAAFSYYPLELISGWLSLDHNDLTFVFYNTCSFWAFSRYLNSSKKIKWAVLIGIFSGMAILNKWLVGLLIYGGWGLYILISEYRSLFKYYVHYVISILISAIVFVPWQLYIQLRFPKESAIAFETNRKHMSEDLGHPGNFLTHLNFLPTAYNKMFIFFMIVGILSILFSQKVNKKLSISFIAMIIVLFSFFSFFVKTKMPAFVYPASGLIIILIAFGTYYLYDLLIAKNDVLTRHSKKIFLLIPFCFAFTALKPSLIINQRSHENVSRNNKIINSAIYQQLPDSITSKYVILNSRPYENIELMFYKDALAYHWYPSEHIIDSLENLGVRFAAFNYDNDQQALPEYIMKDSTIVKLQEKLK